jgi:transcriptional regulator with XRE-family HTH domain
MADQSDKKALMKLGVRLRDAREKLGLTQEQVALKARVSTNYYAVVERGEGNLTFLKLNRIVRALKKVDLSDLI